MGTQNLYLWSPCDSHRGSFLCHRSHISSLQCKSLRCAATHQQSLFPAQPLLSGRSQHRPTPASLAPSQSSQPLCSKPTAAVQAPDAQQVLEEGAQKARDHPSRLLTAAPREQPRAGTKLEMVCSKVTQDNADKTDLKMLNYMKASFPSTEKTLYRNPL